MYQAYDNKVLNTKESKTADSTRIPAKSLIDKFSMPETREHPLYIATRRLVKALDQLEGNLKQVMLPDEVDAKYEQQMSNFQQENTALKQERESLNGAIARLQRQYNDLQKVANAVYDKLDDSVKKLTHMIEE